MRIYYSDIPTDKYNWILNLINDIKNKSNLN
jgi:hypothetical protein